MLLKLRARLSETGGVSYSLTSLTDTQLSVAEGISAMNVCEMLVPG